MCGKEMKMGNDKSLNLLEYISKWPEWKLNALMLDGTDLEIRKKIDEYKEKSHSLMED